MTQNCNLTKFLSFNFTLFLRQTRLTVNTKRQVAKFENSNFVHVMTDIASGYYVDFAICVVIWICLFALIVSQFCTTTNVSVVNGKERIQYLQYSVEATGFKILSIFATYPDWILRVDNMKIAQSCCDLIWLWFASYSIMGSYIDIIHAQYFEIVNAATLKTFHVMRKEYRKMCKCVL